MLLILVIPLRIPWLKLKTFVRLTVAAHKSNSTLLLCRKASSEIMKVKICNGLKPPLTEMAFAVGHWETGNCMEWVTASSECLWQYPEIKHYRESMANKKRQNGRRGRIKSMESYMQKWWITLNVYMCVQGEMEVKKLTVSYVRTKWMDPFGTNIIWISSSSPLVTSALSKIKKNKANK